MSLAFMHSANGAKVHFTEYLVNMADEEDQTAPAPDQPEQPASE